jgi:hypothetical protein
VADGRRRRDVRHRPADLAVKSWALTAPKHPGTLMPRRGDPVPPNVAPTIAAPAGHTESPAGLIFPEDRTP